MLAEIVGYEVIVMHKIKFAKEAADTVIFMDNGRIMEKGSKLFTTMYYVDREYQLSYNLK